MKTKFIFLAILIILTTATAGCIATKESEVLHFNLVVKGDYQNPVFDLKNSTRSLEMVPLLKQPRYDKVVDFPRIDCRIFFNQDVISYSTSEPYTGPNTYHFIIAFKDDMILPQPNENSLIVVKIYDSSKLIKKEYITLNWPDNLK